MASMCETLFGRFEAHRGDDPAAIGPDERWLSVAAGGCLAGYGLSRLRLARLLRLEPARTSCIAARRGNVRCGLDSPEKMRAVL